MTPDRRAFLKASGAALSAAAVGSCAPDDPARPGAGAAARLDPALLRSVADLVLPTELGEAGREEAVRGFEAWARAYEPAFEVNHAYGTAQIRYGPADPVPGWNAQLQALDAEAGKRFGSGYAALPVEVRDEILRRQVSDDGQGMPSPVQARHVAVALLSWWLATPEATDRCYGVRIGPQTCRGIDASPLEPEALP